MTVTASAGGGAYAPLIEAVEAVLARDRSILDRLTDQVRSTLAELTPLAAPAPPPVAGLSRHMIFGAIHRLLMSIPDVAGVLLVVDDAHLADDGTAEACVQLARAHGPVPLLVVTSFRSEAARATLAGGLTGLQRAGRAVALDLTPMERADVAALVADAANPNPAVLDRVLDLAEGNPFVAVELARGGG